jgi:hypothetical protein
MGVHPIMRGEDRQAVLVDLSPTGEVCPDCRGRSEVACRTCGRSGVQRFATGAERGTDLASIRYDLMSWVGLRRYAETCAEGASKYGENCWRLGLPTHDLINHTLAHIARYMDGDRSEDHLAHAAWGLLAAMDNEERRPAMQDGLLGADGSLTDSIRLRLDRFRALRAAGKEGEVSGGP